jgi:hypothetical protein
MVRSEIVDTEKSLGRISNHSYRIIKKREYYKDIKRVK